VNVCDLTALVDCASTPSQLDWWAFILGGIGIGFTVIQLIRSRGALNAARDALESTRASLIKNQLVSVLPGFQEISASIDAALSEPSRIPMQQALSRFCIHGYEAATLLRDTSAEFEGLAEQIIQTTDTASKARAGLFANPRKSVHDIAGSSAEEARNLAARISGVATSIRNDPGSGPIKLKRSGTRSAIFTRRGNNA
jgi:hypothetical protein